MIDAPTTESEYQVWRSCESKSPYPTRMDAARAMRYLKRRKKLLQIYRCTYCKMFHLTSTEEARRRKIR